MPITKDKESEIINIGKKTIDDYTGKGLETDNGYEFRTRDFWQIIFLYTNFVSANQPNLLGVDNRNTFVNEALEYVNKAISETQIDLKDINFLYHGEMALASFVIRSGNRKMLRENNFSVGLDHCLQDAQTYGTGFLKVWKLRGKKKMKCVDPLFLIFNQYNFAAGMKIEVLNKTRDQIINDEKYDKEARERFAVATQADTQGKTTNNEYNYRLYQGVTDHEDGSQEISVFDTEKEIVFYNEDFIKPLIKYYKFDRKKRRGFEDAPGVGCYEEVFNLIVQSNVNRKRLDKVLEISSKLVFTKEIDNERDAYVGKEMIHVKEGAILGYRDGKKIEVLDTGGVKQVETLRNALVDLNQSIGPKLNISDALSGNTLPAGTSGVLGNLLSENSRSVHKDVKKDYANFISKVYDEDLSQYLLKVFDGKDNLKKYLDPNDIREVEKHIINYLISVKQVEATINDEEFSIALAREEVKREIKGKPLISSGLLDELREDVQGIETFISGEQRSKAQTVAFIAKMREEYATRPELFSDPTFVKMLKKEAEYDAGITPIEIDDILQELQRA